MEPKIEAEPNPYVNPRPSGRPQLARKSTATLTTEARITRRLIRAQEEIRRLQHLLFRYQRQNQILFERLDWVERELAGLPQELDSPESPEPSGHMSQQ